MKYPRYQEYRKYTGQKFHRLTIIDFETESKTRPDGEVFNRVYAICNCDCGTKGCRKRLDCVLNGKLIACSTYCTREFRQNLPLGNKNPAFNGIGDMGATFFQEKERQAKRRKKVFTVSHQYLWNLFQKQGGKCALSGLLLTFGKTRTPDTTASLDRINPKIGYIEGNVQWVHKDVNKMKSVFNDDYFVKICRLVVKNKRKKRK